MKKHKAWAQCSGVRNPAEYRKRADLATPSSIDQDFNFITRVERSITRADENALDRKIPLAPARQLRSVDARPKVDIEMEKRGIKVIKAPKGLSRSKTNRTHWANQHKAVMWTVEWVCPDEEKVIGSALETRTIEEAFVNTVGKKKIIKKRKLSLEERAQGAGGAKKLLQHDTEAVRSGGGGDDKASSARVNGDTADRHDEVAPPPTKKDPAAGLYFYLHKPNTPSKVKCLIPLSCDRSLQNALEGRTVLEFPTIFMKDERPAELKPPFITEEEYKSRYGEDVTVPGSITLEDGEVEEGEAPALSSDVDSQKVLEVLARDLAG